MYIYMCIYIYIQPLSLAISPGLLEIPICFDKFLSQPMQMITVPLYIIILTISPHYIIYSIVSTVYHHDQSMYTVIGYHHNYIVPLYSTHCIHSMPSCLMLHHSLGMSHCYHWRLRRSDAALFRALGWAGRRHLAPRGEAVDSQRLGRAGRLHRAVAPG